MRLRLRAVLALLLCFAAAVGCSSIPTSSQPKAIQQAQPERPTQGLPEPEKGLDPLTVVRQFVRASSDPSTDYQAARAYLGAGARRAWRPDATLTIIDDTFGTVYATNDSPTQDPNERVVNVRGTNVGRLGPDSSFIPATAAGPVQVPIRVRLQPDGQWRIAEPPSNVLITQSDFEASYFGVPVYFFAPEANILVPDRRYVLARPKVRLPARVMDLLLAGPSAGLTGAVRNPIGEHAQLQSNVTPAPDGALVVPLTGVEEYSVQDKELIAAQVVRSLQHVITSRVRLLSNGSPLISGQTDWQPSDLPLYEAEASPSPELPGLMAADGTLRSLASGRLIAGPAGEDGAYNVVSAAQSIQGDQLAVVERTAPREVQLRVGDYGQENPVVEQLKGTSMTRPSWRPATSEGGKSGELWTAVNGDQVVRVVPAPNGMWTPTTVNASEILAIGRITGLRLSRDGTRVAAIAGGRLVVASVVRDGTSVTLRAPRVLRGEQLTDVVDVDWLSQDRLAVATRSESIPVARVGVDGFELDQFNSSNLTLPMRAITAAPSRLIVVADANGMWTASDIGDVWRPHQPNRARAEPFYPG